MSEYPKAKYSRSVKFPCVVNDAKEEATLDGEWFDLPDFTNRPRRAVVEDKPMPEEKPKVKSAR